MCNKNNKYIKILNIISVLENSIMAIVQNYFYLLLVIHKFQSSDLKVFKQTV